MVDVTKTGTSVTDTARTTTIIGPDVHLEDGRLSVADDVVIYGIVDGDVAARGRVAVAPDATVNGSIIAESVIISGTVSGAVEANESFRLEESGKLFGHAKAARFAVEPGSTGEFQLTMTGAHTGSRLSPKSALQQYQSALEKLSTMTGTPHSPSPGYQRWVDTQSKGEQAATRVPDVKPEVVIDWADPSPEERERRKRFASEHAVGRMAWSRSVGDEHGAKNSDHFGITSAEADLLADEARTGEASRQQEGTDEMLNSSLLREAVESVRKEAKTDGSDTEHDR